MTNIQIEANWYQQSYLKIDGVNLEIASTVGNAILNTDRFNLLGSIKVFNGNIYQYVNVQNTYVWIKKSSLQGSLTKDTLEKTLNLSTRFFITKDEKLNLQHECESNFSKLQFKMRDYPLSKLSDNAMKHNCNDERVLKIFSHELEKLRGDLIQLDKELSEL